MQEQRETAASATPGAARILFVSGSGEAPARAAIWAAQRGWQLDVLQPQAVDAATLVAAGYRLAIVCDCAMDDVTVAALPAQLAPLPALLATAHGGETRAIAAIRAGYRDYLYANADSQEWRARLQPYLQRASVPRCDAGGMIAVSAAMQAVRERLERIAAADCTVLVIGETGTGKERIAEQLHRHSARAAAPLLPINCAALPDSLLESELFGYEKGAFTGAVSAYPGKLKLADGGTLFLDEIGDMSLAGQAKLLRALESREFHRLGSRSATRFDVRVVAATNQALEHRVEQGLFRKDLFFRLNVARIDLPPLRERRDDIEPLLRHYLAQFDPRGDSAREFEPAVLRRLLAHDWPGNIRELKNVLEAMLICARGPRLTLDDLPTGLHGGHSVQTAPAPRDERELLLATLNRLNWNKSRVAEQLRWSRMTLYRKLAKYEIQDRPGALLAAGHAAPAYPPELRAPALSPEF